ncbi:MAG: HAD-IA family hydrolase [Paludibacteraceae bacterium]|nr:HAD-IA family hydrolase [Paludibacteraceae bacterium]
MKAFFFDMDGVLFNSMPAHAQAWEEVMSKYNLCFTAYDCFLNEGRTGYDVIQECYCKVHNAEPPRELVEKIYEEKTEAFLRRGTTDTIPNIKDVLAFLQEKDVRIWVVTGSGQQTLFARLDETFPGVFIRERMITAFDVVHGKPDPEPYLKAWERSGLEKKDCFVVENAPLGIISAKRAGLTTFGVNTGILKPEDLSNAGADKVFNNMKELLEYLQLEMRN